MWVLVRTSPIDRVMRVTPIAEASRFRFARHSGRTSDWSCGFVDKRRQSAMHPEYSRSYASNAAIAETDQTERKSDRVKIVPAVTEVRQVQRNRFRPPRIDFLIDWVNPHGPDKHHDQDTGGREGREDSHHRLLPRNDSPSPRSKRVRPLPARRLPVRNCATESAGWPSTAVPAGSFWVTLKEMRKRNPATMLLRAPRSMPTGKERRETMICRGGS
jgi:hypothetical protein